jgi:hypothetical protein
LGPTFTDETVNPLDPVRGFGEVLLDAWYENPMIGQNLDGNGCTNHLDRWMTIRNLQAAVNGLTPGLAYNFYRKLAPCQLLPHQMAQGENNGIHSI